MLSHPRSTSESCYGRHPGRGDWRRYGGLPAWGNGGRGITGRGHSQPRRWWVRWHRMGGRQPGRWEIRIVRRWGRVSRSRRWDVGGRERCGRRRGNRWRGIGRVDMRVVRQVSRRSVGRWQSSVSWSFCFHHGLKALITLPWHVRICSRHPRNVTGGGRGRGAMRQRRRLMHRGRMSGGRNLDLRHIDRVHSSRLLCFSHGNCTCQRRLALWKRKSHWWWQ